jgi:hypothetical protein
LSFCSCFLEICFLLLSLFFLPPLSPIARSFHIVSLYPPCVASSRCEFAFCLSDDIFKNPVRDEITIIETGNLTNQMRSPAACCQLSVR